MFRPLEEPKLREMPEKKLSFWQLAGPGAILVGLSIGAGEIIVWPRVTAQYGASMIWAAMLGVFLQVWINFEIGRWTIATGETVYTGYCRVWRGFAPLFILLTIAGWLAPGWARASGLALKALLVGPQGFGSDTFWTVATFLAVGGILFGPKLVYHSVEITIEVLVAVIVVGLALVAINVGTAETWRELGAGVLNIGYRDPAFSVKDLFIALVFAGAGGTANLFYTFYLRDKHIGMGVHVPSLHNPLRGRAEKAPATGFRFEDTEENARRFKSWWRYVQTDQWLFFWLLNTVTILLFIFGALAVLHPKGIVPAGGTLVWDEALVLGEIWGGTGRVIFLLVGVATLFSTQLALVDGVSRSIADIVYTNFRCAQKRDVSWWYLVIALGWMLAGCVITFIMERRGVTDLGFLLNAAYMGGFAMAVYVPLTLYLNLRYLPKSARPRPLSIVMMVIASVVYVGFAVACICWDMGILK
jgi:Mn2+/Fe2+ NRAMP family transporter